MSRFSNTSSYTQCLPQQVASMPNALYHSLQGQYYVGYADNLFFEKTKNAWAALSNPIDSGVNLFVNVWTVTELSPPTIRVQIWFNATLPGTAAVSPLVTPANTAFCPPSIPKVQLIQTSNVAETPTGGALAFVRRIPSGETVVAEEDGKFIIPPGGNFAAFLSNPEGEAVTAYTRVAFGWWEEPLCHCNAY